MIRIVAFVAALLLCNVALGQEPQAVAEPAKVEYLKCTSLMEKAASSALMAFSSREKVASLKARMDAKQCLVELTPRIQDDARRSKFANVEAIWDVAVDTPSAIALGEYIQAAQKFLYDVE